MAARDSRAAQINPDRFWVGVLAIALVTVIMLASYIFSFAAIAEAGGWTGVPLTIAWLAAVFIDGPILTYTVSLVVLERRGESRRGLRRTRFFLYAFTSVSVILNFAHAGSFWGWDYGQMEAWFGALMAVAAPLAALAASEEVVRLAFAKPKSGDTNPVLAAEAEADRIEREFSALVREHDDPVHEQVTVAIDHRNTLPYTLAVESGNEVGTDVHDAHRG